MFECLKETKCLKKINIRVAVYKVICRELLNEK
ncbi:hypothetical protein T11_12446 [Trichinella zimbabwensis]|uniref:Uncharacterized protein n=1 Tax=Trichinella zimbabwensis TaxID=268475 RepID=A0A0V1GCN8_9BILA|nr:hypothetical protein T11_12446 [Trichinella zimbabwensis]